MENAQHKSKGKALKIIIIVLCSIAAVVLAAVGCFWIYINSLLNNVEYDEIDYSEIVEVNSEAEVKFEEDYTHIALFGIDAAKENSQVGRSDAIIVLTIDRKHNKLKLSSIARDSYVAIDGHGKEKITHAWMYGKAKLAMSTINQNFKMNITEYVSVNFNQFIKVVDYIGGVYVDVNEGERNVINSNVAGYTQLFGMEVEPVEKTGYQLLNGPQALAYSRDRTTGTDVERTARQREVIMAMFERVKDLPLTKLPELIETVLKQCTTTLSNKQMIDIATWAASSKPTFEQLSLPDKSCNAKGKIINTYWVWYYDIDFAAQRLHDFILEEGEFNKQAQANSSVEG